MNWYIISSRKKGEILNMSFTLISVFASAVVGFFLVNSIAWVLSLVVLSLILFVSWKRNISSKLANFVLIVGILFSFFGSINSFDPSYFYIFINLAALFATFYEAFNKKLLIILSWALNAFSLGYIIAALRDINLGIIFGIIIFLIGLRDVFASKKVLDEDKLDN
ncbi:hypothetical protein [Petrotoga sp. 9PW.55.5.1]|uniref:hypothetical protein n=1 Tax=Petrotoga sp. 9PW.55.5.1 TaxID=1308979 RepID=UPI0011BD1E0B|nr:hypothetical protein [Petrotoga sp. 9PW.55.5.1]